MPIIGIGVDVVDIARFEAKLATPGMSERLFTPNELAESTKPATLAGKFAAKEASIKAFGDSTDFSWQDFEVRKDAVGKPHLHLAGAAQSAAAKLGVSHLHLSITHDGGVAIAYVIAESRTEGGEVARTNH